ncbi:MAG: Hint domain-containing protein [Caldisericaceae bacterium]
MELNDKIYFGEPIQDRFYNGFSDMETVLARFSNKVGVVKVKDLFLIAKNTERMLSKEEDIWIKDIVEEMYVNSYENFDKVISIIRRRVYEPLIRIEVGKKVTVVSASHKIIISFDNGEHLIKASNLKVGDKVFVSKDGSGVETAAVTKVMPEKKQHLHVYGLVTVYGGAFISGIFQKSY